MEILPNPLAPAPRLGAASPAAPAHDRPSTINRWQRDGEDPADIGPPPGEFGLADLLDIVNPLQHLPLIGNLYRALTGDTISGPAQVLGAALYGGPLGLVSGIVKAVATEINGADPGDILVARLIGTDAPDEIAVAQAAPELGAGPEGSDGGDPAAPALHGAADPSAPPVLTGDAALAALFGDLRAQGQAIAPEIAAPRPAADTLDREEDQDQDRRALGAAVPAHGFSARMMDGLDKYRTLAVERGGAGRPDTARLDRAL